MFEELFRRIYAKNREIRVMGLWGKDGLALDKVSFEEGEEAALDIELYGAEVADIIARVEAMKMSPEGFYLKVMFRGYYLIVFSLTPDYFLLALAGTDVIEGRLNFFVNLYRSQLISAL